MGSGSSCSRTVNWTLVSVRGLVLSAVGGDHDGVEGKLAVHRPQLHPVAGPRGDDRDRAAALLEPAPVVDADGVVVVAESRRAQQEKSEDCEVAHDLSRHDLPQ